MMPSASAARSSGSSAAEMRRICQAISAPINATSAPRRHDRPQAGLVTDGQHEERTEDEGPGEDDDGDRAQHGEPPLRLGELGQADRRGRHGRLRRPIRLRAGAEPAAASPGSMVRR